MERKEYHKVSMSMVAVEPGSSAFLKGSATTTNMKIKTVTVEQFQSGFEDKNGNDFATISFD